MSDDYGAVDISERYLARPFPVFPVVCILVAILVLVAAISA